MLENIHRMVALARLPPSGVRGGAGAATWKIVSPDRLPDAPSAVRDLANALLTTALETWG
jgi:hypothetical protein